MPADRGRSWLLLATLVSSLWSLSVQGVGIVWLSTSDYGRFALAYLLYGVMTAALFACVCDVWSRVVGQNAVQVSRRLYRTVTFWLSVTFGFVGFLLLWCLTDVTNAALVSVASTLSLIRTGCRFSSVARGRVRLIWVPELVSVIAFCVALLVSSSALGRLESLCLSWAIGSCAAMPLFRVGPVGWPREALQWFGQYRHEIRVMLGDSVIVEGTVYGVPLIMASMMPLASFSVYRGVSSSAIPVRLILNPLRPVIARQSNRSISSPRSVALVLTVSFLLGGVVGLGVLLLGVWPPLRMSTLGALHQYWILVGVFVSMSFAGTFYFVSNRSRLPTRELMIIRIIQAVSDVGGPLFGYFVAFVPGAIFGYVVSTSLNTLIAMYFAVRDGSRQEAIDRQMESIS